MCLTQAVVAAPRTVRPNTRAVRMIEIKPHRNRPVILVCRTDKRWVSAISALREQGSGTYGFLQRHGALERDGLQGHLHQWTVR